jgi:hypothetical protein
MRRRLLSTMAACALVLAACGEPPVPLDVPERDFAQAVLDEAGIVDEDDRALQRALGAVRLLGWDPVLVAFEADGANMGLADRAGRKVLDAWGADIALVAVADPGHFMREGAGRQRFFGLFARDVREVPRAVRERIAEQLVPPVAARNDWTGAFALSLRELADALGEVDEDIR